MKRSNFNKLARSLLFCSVLTFAACGENQTSLLATQAFDGRNSATSSNGLMETPLSAIDIDRELVLLSKRIDRLEAKPANAESLTRGLKAFRNGDYIEANFYLQHSLKYDPQNPHLHKMNAISYHL